MAAQFIPAGHVTTPPGFRAAAGRAGIKPSGNPDLTVLVADPPAVAAGVFTTNRVHAYNVDRNRALLPGPLRAIVVTSGNANVATGEQGRRDTDELAELVAAELGCAPAAVAVAQTGVIGRPLPMERIRPVLPEVVAAASPTGGAAAAEAICTTDTRLKHVAATVELAGVTVTLGAIAKGAGMIHPQMATLLCFITTDAVVAAAPLQAALGEAVDQTLNAVTIDGDQSTSDTCLLLAGGNAAMQPIETVDDPRWPLFRDALAELLEPLAELIARDGEGATKLLRVTVSGALTAAEARLAARAVAASSLVKCALAGGDPNWGRIACAVGYSGATVDPARLGLAVCGTPLMAAGEPLSFDAAAVSAAMAAETVEVTIDLGLGEATGRAYGCDLTVDYVTFNAEYTT